MNSNDLTTFLAVYETGSFSRAAERLHLTQPAISKRIDALERDLGNRLFDRVGKRVYLTGAGNLLEPRARALLSAMDDTRILLLNLNTSVDGRLQMTTSHHIGLHRLGPILKAYTRAFPDVELDINFEDSEAAHHMVAHAETELAVVTLDPAAGDHPGLDYLTLWHDPLCFVVASDHQLASKGTVLLEDLAGCPAVIPGTQTYTGRIILQTFRDRGLNLHSTMSTNYLETLGMLVEAGLGWSVLPSSMVTGSLKVLDTDAPEISRTLGCVTNPSRTLSNAAS
ncbi:MAG: LysR family transcriptional regulator, partial [Proteobacteria bacterium]|nr:LysR family transcriptional regulator [Pseudomonadota bacterium]